MGTSNEQKNSLIGTKSARMQIFLINWMDIKHPDAGGAEVHLHEIAKRLVQAGHQVMVLCSKYDGSLDSETVDGVKVIRRGHRYNLSLAVLKFVLMESSKWKQANIIVEDISKMPFFILPFIRNRRGIAVTHHFFKGVFIKEVPLAFVPIIWMGERLLVLYRGRPFIVQSLRARTDLMNIGIPETDIQVIHTGMDHQVYIPGTLVKSDKPLAVYVGRVIKYKCLHHLIRAMAVVKESLPNATLVIAGKGEDKLYRDLKRLSDSLGLEETITFLGYISPEEKVKLIQNAHVLIYLSAKEGWGLPIIEANACGTPAIAYDVPALNEAILDDETGLLVQYGDIDALAKTIVKVLTDIELRQRLSRNAIEWASNFTWDKTAKEFEGIFQEAV